jgi:opacity protein-like surface antigen
VNARNLVVAVVMGMAVWSAPQAQDVLAGLPPPSQSAAAQPAQNAQNADGPGWNTKHALLFQLQNVFSDGNGILNEYAGGVGAQYNLAPDRAIRLSVSLARFTNPPYEEETQTAGFPAEKEDVIPGITSSLQTTIRASYLFRLSQSTIAPYLGAGASLRFASDRRDGTDDDTAGIVLKYDNTDRQFGFGLTGQLGLEWRVHRSVSVFAEYGLGLSLFDRTSSEHSTTYNGQKSTSEYVQTRTLNFSTGLEQGGELGIMAFF